MGVGFGVAMKLAEIQRAIKEGFCVYWQNPSYEVIADATGTEYYIRCSATGHCIKLVQSDGVTLNGAETAFYVHESKDI
jgi:hypothetical protein